MLTKPLSEIKNDLNIQLSKIFNQRLGENIEILNISIFEDIILIRVKDILPLAERSLLNNKDGLNLIKNLKVKLMENIKKELIIMIKHLLGKEPLDIHTSIDATESEWMIVFSFSDKII